MADPRLAAHVAALGASDADVAGVDDAGLIGLAGDLQLASTLNRQLVDVAREAGWSVDDVREVYAQLGLSVDELAGFGDGDVAMVSLIRSDTSGLIAEVGPQLLRVTGAVLARLAEAAVAAYVQDIEPHTGATDGLIAMADQNAFASSLAVALGHQLPTVFRHHMWMAVRRQRSAQLGVESPEIARLAIGFVDLVGFTSLSNDASPYDLIQVIEEFERRAFETAGRHGGRIVKSIGDEVMIVGSNVSVVATIALDLIATTGDDPTIAPRGGVSAGDVLFRLGDYYGPVVNLASRLAGEAVPGELLIDQSSFLDTDLQAVPAGRRTLKGFAEPVQVFAVEMAGSA